MRPKTPLWMCLVILAFLLPVFSMAAMLDCVSPSDESARTFIWIYPFYMLLSAYLAWQAYPQRSYVTWMLLALMALSTAAMWLMINNLSV